MSDSDSGWQRPKRRKTKEERLMAALKAVTREGSSSRRSSRGRSRNRNRSRNNERKGSKGPRSRTRDQTPAKKEKKTKPHTRPPVLRAAPTSNEWQCANCAQTNWMTRKECRQCHKMPPGPSNLMPRKEVASGSTGHPHATWADVAKGKSEHGSDKTAFQAGKASPVPEVPVKEGETHTQDSQAAQYEKTIAALSEGCSLRDNLKTQIVAKSHRHRKPDQGSGSTKQQPDSPEHRSSKPNSRRSSSRSSRRYKTISRRLPPPRPNSKTQSVLSSQAPQPQTLAQPASPSAGSSLQNSKDFCSRVRKAWPQIQKKRKEQNGVATKAARPLEPPRRPHRRRQTQHTS